MIEAGKSKCDIRAELVKLCVSETQTQKIQKDRKRWGKRYCMTGVFLVLFCFSFAEEK